MLCHGRQKMLTESRMIQALVCLILVASFGCQGTTDPPRWDYISQENPEPTLNPVKTTDDLVIYLDASLSMPGYVSSDGQTIYSRTLKELRGFATTLAPNLRVIVRKVGLSLESPQSDLQLAQASVDSNFYNEHETDLAGAITSFSKSLLPEAPDEYPPPRYHILVTDGVQSTRLQNHNSSCYSGSDQFCVRKKILELLEKGWGGCIIGIRSQFHGSIYSELNLLKGEPYKVRYDTTDNDPKTYRPFYLYIFSPDPSILDKMVEELKERIRPLVGEGDMRELALTLPYTRGDAEAKLIIPKEMTGLLKTSNIKEASPPRFTLRLSLNANETASARFYLPLTLSWSKHALDSGTIKELSTFVNWDMVSIYPQQSLSSHSGGKSQENGSVSNSPLVRYPEIKLENFRIDESGNPVLDMIAFWPRATGKVDWKIYKIEGRLNLASHVPPWVTLWSTDDDTTWEMGNKTFDLESALLNLWRNPILKKQVVARFYIRIGPE